MQYKLDTVIKYFSLNFPLDSDEIMKLKKTYAFYL